MRRKDYEVTEYMFVPPNRIYEKRALYVLERDGPEATKWIDYQSLSGMVYVTLRDTPKE